MPKGFERSLRKLILELVKVRHIDDFPLYCDDFKNFKTSVFEKYRKSSQTREIREIFQIGLR